MIEWTFERGAFLVGEAAVPLPGDLAEDEPEDAPEPEVQP